MENKLLKTVGKGYFLAVAFLMYFFIKQTVNAFGGISYRHILSLVLFASAFVYFLVKPNLARGAATVKPTLVYCLPMLVTITVSLYIWFSTQVHTDVMLRGISNVLIFMNMLSATLAAISLLYVFGENGIWYNLIAILASNLLTLVEAIMEYGLGTFMSEFAALIASFGVVLGSAIKRAEIHELAFCLGAYLLYMLLKPQKKVTFFVLLALTGFCFIAAFKRIAIIAVIASLLIGWGLLWIAKYHKKTSRALTILIAVLAMIGLEAYIVCIKLDMFDLLEKIGIETMGRAKVYNLVDPFYSFSPEFIGHGMGFLNYYRINNPNVLVISLHNDFLQFFIELGFWGYILWLSALLLIRVCFFSRKGKVENGIVCLCLCLYLVIVSLTDNTMSYPLVTTTLAIIMIGHNFDKEVQTKEALFGAVSLPHM